MVRGRLWIYMDDDEVYEDSGPCQICGDPYYTAGCWGCQPELGEDEDDDLD
jgi:hypothetical protein